MSSNLRLSNAIMNKYIAINSHDNVMILQLIKNQLIKHLKKKCKWKLTLLSVIIAASVRCGTRQKRGEPHKNYLQTETDTADLCHSFNPEPNAIFGNTQTPSNAHSLPSTMLVM